MARSSAHWEEPLTESQRELAKKHGTPSEFAIAVLSAVPSMISIDEAYCAIWQYQIQWERCSQG